MTAPDVLAVLATLEDEGIRVWLDGGWGVEALLGSQHRAHDDVDLDHLPTRMVLRSETGKQVDLHPVTFDSEGTGWQAGASPDGSDCPYPANGFTTGTVLGRTVGCLSADLQVAHHSGYTPQAHDHEDMHRLAARFRMPLATEYGV